MEMISLDKKIRNGDAVTDDELDQAIRFYKKLHELLDQLGPRWYFANNEARRLYQQYIDYSYHREARRKVK